MANIFEDFAEANTPKWRKRLDEREARYAANKAARAAIPPMVKRGLELKLEQKAEQLKRYRQWKAEVREGLTRGDYGIEIIDLFKILRKRKLDIFNYTMSADWMLACSLETRLTLLGYIDQSIIVQDIRNGYPPFNDALPGEAKTPFLIIRERLTDVKAVDF